ncbi:MAG: type II toxin-antitoxin system prevent-host-death family antitoxin [Verrucomicrobiota bacterium]
MSAIEIGSFEAKNRLSELLAQAERGQKIVITRRGKRVAMLGPLEDEEAPEEKRSLVELCREFRKHVKPGPETIKEMIEEGRR